MKVLLSAYACEPNKGSEPGVGWNWAVEIAGLGHEVWVLTRSNNHDVIEAECKSNGPIPNLQFIYCDLPRWTQVWKKRPGGLYFYYLFWQWKAYGLARKVHARVRFDMVHHITFGSVRCPSFLGKLGIPFVFGPVGGGERAPLTLRFGYRWRWMILDTLRDISNLLVRFDPLMRQTFYRTEQIYTKTTQTAAVIPRKSQPKVKCLLEIGIGSLLERDTKFGQKEYGELKVLYVGQFLAWKGMHLGLLAFARALCSIASARLTMVGKGPDERHWRQIADAAGISSFVTWRPWLSHDHLTEIYAEHDVLLFPSLHDSSGNVVLEAMAHGLPIICLDLGGPAVLVDNTCGRVISTGSASKEQVVRRLAHALIEVGNDRSQLEHLSAGAVAAARKFAWSDVVARVYPSSRNP